MTIALVGRASVTGANGGTTTGFDSTGANLVTIHAAWASVLGTITISDNKGNSYTARTEHSNGSVSSQIFDVAAPTVGSGHTFTLSGSGIFAAMEAYAWSGAAASPFDQQNGNTVGSGASSLQTGSVTPTQDNEMLFAGVCVDANGSNTYTIDLSFTNKEENDYTGGTNEGGAAADLIETTAAAKNPTWSWSSATGGAAASIATYKAAAAAAAVLDERGYPRGMRGVGRGIAIARDERLGRKPFMGWRRLPPIRHLGIIGTWKVA